MKWKLVLAAVLCSLMIGSAVAQDFETRLAVPFSKHDYPTWYLTKPDSLSDTSWYIRDSAGVDTSFVYWTKPGWKVYTGFEASYATDSVDTRIYMQWAMAVNDQWNTYDSVDITAASTMSYTVWGLDTMPARYFRFILSPIVAPFFNSVKEANDTLTSVEIMDADSSTWIVTAAQLTEANDYWNGASIAFTSGDCAGQTETVTDFVATGDTVYFTACSACTLAVSLDSFTITLPHVDSGLTYTGKISTRGN